MEKMEKDLLRVSSRIFNKRQRDNQESASPASSQIEDHVGKAAERQRRYRERVKADPEKYKEFREKAKERVRKHRQTMTPEEKAHKRELSNQRVRKCRGKKKEQGLPLNKPKPKTRASSELEREKAKIRKQKSRAKMTPQKKASINKRRREQRAENKLQSGKEALSHPNSSSSAMDVAHGFNSTDAKRKAVKRTLNTMPQDPQKFAEVLDGLTSVRSPRKLKAMENIGIHSAKKRKLHERSKEVMEGLQKEYTQIKKTRTKTHRRKRRLVGKILASVLKRKSSKFSLIRKHFGITKKYIKKCCDDDDTTKEDDLVASRKDALSPSKITLLHDFFENGNISRADPKVSSVRTKSGISTRFMEKTLREAYKEFQQEHNFKISFSRFAKSKPKHVKTVKYNKLRACCCEYCTNVDLRIAAVNSFLAKCDHRELYLGPTKYDLANSTICGCNKDCLDRKCSNCGVGALRMKLQPVLNQHADVHCVWQAWAFEKRSYQNKKGEEKLSSRRTLQLKEGPFAQLVDELEEELQPFALHLANANWQHKQFAQLRKNLPGGWLLMCMDFGENLTCQYQDEVQGAHWGRQQITIHPIVAYYRCPDDDEVVTESFICITSDLKHDNHAVQHFQLEVTHLLQKRGLIFQKIVHFSDGCPSQYKGKVSFADVSFSAEDTGISTEKHFFGTRHGKGPCDAEIGVVKRIASLAVRRRRTVISCAQDLYRFGKASLTKPQQRIHCHSRRTFLYMNTSIDRNRLSRAGPDVKAIKGTRKLHCVRGLMPYLVATRERSCFCEYCVAPRPGNTCTNEEFCGFWDQAVLHKQRRVVVADQGAAAVENTGDADVGENGAARREEASQQGNEDSSIHQADDVVLEDSTPGVTVVALTHDQPDESDHQSWVSSSSPDISLPASPIIETIELPEAPRSRPDSSPSSGAQISRTDSSLTVNTCVVVRYPDRLYPGIIKAVLQDGFQVQFLRPHMTKKGVFVYPDIPDIQVVAEDMIIARHVELVPRGKSFREWTVDGFRFS